MSKNIYVIDVLKKKCLEVAELRGVDGYYKELLIVASEIVSLERNHVVQPGQIQRKIADKVETLSKTIVESM